MSLVDEALSQVAPQKGSSGSLVDEALSQKPTELTGKSDDSLLHKVAKFAGQVGAMGIGAARGAAVGAPFAPPYGAIAGGVIGGAMGYAGVESLEKAIKGEPLTARTLMKDIGEGVATEMGGRVIGKAVGSGMKALAESDIPFISPKRIYSSSIKTPLSGNWKKVLPGREYSMRELTALTGLSEETIVNKEAPALIQGKINNVLGQVNSVVKDLTAKGGNETAAAEVKSSLAPLKIKAKFSDESAAGEITKVEERVDRAAGYKSKLTPDELNMLKQQAQKDIDWNRTTPIIKTNGRFHEDALRAVSDKCMKLIEDMDPTIKYLNKKASAYIDLKAAIEMTLARQWNKDVVPSTSKLLALGNMALAALDTVLSFPNVRSRLAIALGRASGLPANAVGRSAALAIKDATSK